MVLAYDYNGDQYEVFVQWTADTGYSTVFREIAQKISGKHWFSADHFQELAEQLDGLADKLYKQIHRFIDEYHGVPYRPHMRQAILQACSEIRDAVRESMPTNHPKYDRLLIGIFCNVADKLCEIADIYLTDHAYQCKFRGRLRSREQYIETTLPGEIACEFEDTLLQMTDLSRLLDCLPKKQKERLVKHIFLGFTMREIADDEGTTRQAVQQSVSAALTYLRTH